MKKITTIGILGLFLFISLTAVSASNINTIKSDLGPETKYIIKNHDKLPDLQMYIKIRNYPLFNSWGLSKFIVYNKGTATIPKGTPIVSRATITLDGEVKDVFWVSVILLSPFKPGMSFEVITHSTILMFPKEKYKGEELKVILDPPLSDDYRWPEYNPDPEYGIVLESNENNNLYTHTFTKSLPFSITINLCKKQYEYMNIDNCQYFVSYQYSQSLL